MVMTLRAAAQGGLAGRPELLQGGEQAVMVAAGAGGGERLRQQAVCVHRGLAEQPALLGHQPRGHLLGGLHARQSNNLLEYPTIHYRWEHQR
jgi:hypothetical protein